MTKEGQANLAFEATEESTNNRNFEEPNAQNDPEIEASCRLFGLIKLPHFCQRLFLSAAWILVFLSLASTIQVKKLKFN